jgi:hypothetical protein
LKLVSPYFAKAIESPVGGGSKNRLYIDFPLMVASAIKEFAYHGKVTPVSIEAALFLIEAAHQ